MKINGLWTVEFHVPFIKSYGMGMVVLENNRIIGGDSGFYYVGNCYCNDKEVSGRLNIVQYNEHATSIIPGLQNWYMDFVGQIICEEEILFEGKPLSAHGTLIPTPEEMKINLSCHKIFAIE
ncbi:MAG: hypothetical protein GKR92_05435 [Gammaproteobacteria bacterium]|nr:MAG: hypothetical protein GKR92_05435 [Gammaproteobacteria bacterium]